MSTAASFNRPALQRQALFVAMSFGAVLCLILLGFWAAGIWPGRNRLTPVRLLMVCGLIVTYVLWNALRKPRSELKSWVQFRVHWRRRRWFLLFGFATAIMLFGVGLGAACSVEHWFELPPAKAALFTLAYAAAGGALGFFGGFSLHFPAVHGTGGAR